jgi:CHAT domain-containing protein
MSLKEVYDDSTSELMIRFYRHLMGGASKREALVKAQQEIRALGYTDSIHWASFILLDAF